ncbi:hypothetical protein HN51_055907 [Arachis hypogaea]|uniref:Legume lectin domain-containing protein n=2 Tax=Arachis TaxID=3817 RepID=A0A444XRQ8_ARAHY|nr:galactose-binding lectin-like [Arachis hypogaea]RYQ92437.1 hypothetical protein Ahy_B09g098665 [Arachis hypogaea]
MAILALVVALIAIHTHSVNSKEEVTFNFEKFDKPTPGDYCSLLTFEGDATVIDNEIQLTKLEKNRVGRVSYSHPIRLYDSKTGEVAKITTKFKFFNKEPDYSKPPAEGMTFFIAPYKSVLPSNSYGAHFGLQTGPPAGPADQPPASHDNFVAVEFDTRTQRNYGDPEGKHFGIDVNQ